MNPRIAFVAAPLLTFAYGVIRILDGLDGSRGPGLAWTTGHLAFIAAMGLFVYIFWQMRRMAGGDALSTVIAVVATAGALALTTQFTIDVVAGLLSADNLSMSLLSREIRDTPGITFAAYDVGPYLFYVGQFALVVRLAVMRRIKGWTPLLVLCDLIMPNIDKDLIPLGAILLLVSFASISHRAPSTDSRSVPSTAKPTPTLV
jgi:hypothetical protein